MSRIEVMKYKLSRLKMLTQVTSEMEKPNKEKYGWHNQNMLDDLESGWQIEGGKKLTMKL